MGSTMTAAISSPCAQRAGEQSVHPGDGIADRHRTKGVAVVAAPDRQQLVALWPAGVVPVLDGHFQGDLDAHRAGVAEEHVVEALRSKVDQRLRQPHRGLVGQSPEHHVRKRPQLTLDGGVEHRVVVAVDHAPPRRHSVDQFTPVLEVDPHPIGGRDPIGGEG